MVAIVAFVMSIYSVHASLLCIHMARSNRRQWGQLSPNEDFGDDAFGSFIISQKVNGRVGAN